MRRTLLLRLAFFFILSAVLLEATGGFVASVGGMRVSARSPMPSLMVAGMVLAAWLLAAWRARALEQDLESIDRWLQASTPAIVGAAALLAAAAAAVFHSVAATGADASGYLSHAAMLLDGRLLHPEPLAVQANWPNAPQALAPLGWRAALDPGWQAPTYAIGLPLLLSPWLAIGGETVAAMVLPATFAVAVWGTGMLARQVAGPLAAVLAASWLATSPVALIQSMQVMSDVPVTAAWLLCWWLVLKDRPLAAGICAGAAVLIRPNLAPLAALPALYVLVRRRDLRRATRFAVPVVGAGMVVAALQWHWFGSPLRSGYGTAEEIYALSNVMPNATLYAQWLVETHGPWLLAAPLALMLPSPALRWLLSFAALVVLGYLVYAQFESWTYLRFLLPALAIAMVAVAALVDVLLARAPSAVRVPAVALLILALVGVNIGAARRHDVFDVAARQARGRVVGEALAAVVAPGALIVSAEHSGTMRYYTRRSVVRWDLTEGQVLSAAVAQARGEGREVWVVLDDWEEEAFRRRFPDVAAAALDAAPAVSSAPGVGIRTHAWRLTATKKGPVPFLREP